MGCRRTATSRVDPLQRSVLGAYKLTMATVATWRCAGAWRCCVLAFAALARTRSTNATPSKIQHSAPVRTHVRQQHSFIDAARIPTHKNQPLRRAMHLICPMRSHVAEADGCNKQRCGGGWSMLRCLDPGEPTVPPMSRIERIARKKITTDVYTTYGCIWTLPFSTRHTIHADGNLFLLAFFSTACAGGQ
jgi:hypothetical protein